MKYINTQTQEALNLRQIRKAHPNVSLPRQPTDEALNPLGYAVVHSTERPNGDVVTEGQPEQRDGKWYQTWEVRDFTQEELDQQYQATIPRSITPRQARLALLNAGLLAQVATALDSLPSPDKEAAKIEWEYATTIERDSAWVANLGSALELTEKQVDDLFLQAIQL